MVKLGWEVRVVMTPAAMRFVGPASFEGIVGAPVLTSEWERDPLRGAFPGEPQPEHDPIGHLAVVEKTDAYLVAPASANTVAKLAAAGEMLYPGAADFIRAAAAVVPIAIASGALTHALESDDVLYDNLPVDGIDLTVASPCPGAGPLLMWLSAAGTDYSYADGLRARVFVVRSQLDRAGGLIPLVTFVVVSIEASPDANFDLLLQLVADGEITVVHDQTYDLDDIVDAYRRVDGGHKVGNVVVRP